MKKLTLEKIAKLRHIYGADIILKEDLVSGRINVVRELKSTPSMSKGETYELIATV